MGCMVSGRVEPVAAHESRVDIPNQSATLKQVLEENKQIKHKEKKRKKKKRKTDRQYLPLVEDSQQKNKTSKVKIENFGEDQVPKKENVTTATDSSTTLPSKTRLHSKENTGENRQNMTNSDQETVTKCKKKKKKRRRKEKQTSNSERTNEENNDFKNSLDKDEDKRPDTKDEEKRTQFENAAGTKDIYDNILKESKIYPAEENSYTEVIKMSEEKKKEKDASSYQSQNNENQNDVLVRKETDFRETSNVKLTEADKRQVDYINTHAKETEKTQPLQKKEGGVFRDVRRRDNSVIIYQNTNDKEKWNFLHIDSHALQAPRDVELSVETLANYLSKPVHATLETVRAFFVWITNNIRYDTDALESDRIAPSDPQDVLKPKTCVCAGYAKLFEALCSFKGVEVKCINGYSKGYKYSAEKIFTLNKKEDHAWNAVKINEKWFLIDCTWGAKEGLSRNESYNDFYFLTDPEHLICTHFPYMNDNLKESYEWQLLQTPVSIDDFSKKIKLTYQAMTWKIYPKSHKQGFINITTPSDIILLDTEEQLLTVKAIFLNMNNGNFEETGCVFARKETKSELHITVRPKSFGKYLLQLYGQTDKNTNKVIMLMEYIIKSLCIFDLRPFPQVSELWGIKPEAYDCGLSKINDIPILHKVKRETEIRLQTTRQIHALVHLHAAKNNLIGDEGYVLAESDENALVLKVRSPSNDYYKLTLYLKTVLNPNENNEYHAMATFLINCTEPLVPCIPFPKTFPKTVEYYCKIIEPVYKRIPACTRIRFRMKSDKLQIANVSWKKMDKIGDEWIVDIFSPGAGEVVQINGNVTQDGKCWCLFEYETVEDSNEIMKSMQSRFMKPDEQYIGKTKDVNNLNKKHPLESCGLRTDIPSVNDPRTKYAKQWGIKPKSHTCSTIKIEDEVEITAEDSMDRLVFTVNFFLETSEFVNIDEYVFLRKESPKELKVTIRPPSSGTYILRLYGHIDKDSQTHELLLSYTIISSMEGGLVVKPYPTHNGLWSILSEAFTHGLHNENAYNISTFHSCKRNLEICFRTEQKVYSTSKLEPVNNTLLDGHHYTILESTEDYLKVKINFPFEDYYKLTLWFKRSTKETDDCRYSEMANFLINCREPNRPCMPFPITSSYTQKFSCKLIEPMSGFLPEQSIIKFRIKSPIVKTFLLAGEKMERINDEYITIVTTPSKGNEFHLSGKTEDEEKYWVLFQYEIVSKSGKRNNETYIANTILESKEWDLMCNYNQERKVPVTNYAKEIGIQPLSHKGEFINVHEFVDIKISDIKNCLDNCNATLSRLSNTTDIRTENIFIRKEKTREIAVAIIPPPPGLYCLKIYGQGGSKPKECLPLLLQYTVKSDGVDEDRPFPKNDGLWGFLSDADNYGFQNTGAHLVPVMYKVKGEATLYFPTYQNINRSVKLTSEHNMPDGSNCTLIESDNHCFNITLRLPFTGYYKLTIFSETDSKHHKTGTFLIDCIEPANPRLPFPTTFASTQYYNCILIEPLNGTLPANSSVTCKFRSSIVFSAVVNGSMMTKEGNEWVLTTTTPSTGEAFDIFGKSSDRDTFSVLFRYVIR